MPLINDLDDDDYEYINYMNYLNQRNALQQRIQSKLDLILMGKKEEALRDGRTV